MEIRLGSVPEIREQMEKFIVQQRGQAYFDEFKAKVPHRTGFDYLLFLSQECGRIESSQSTAAAYDSQHWSIRVKQKPAAAKAAAAPKPAGYSTKEETLTKLRAQMDAAQSPEQRYELAKQFNELYFSNENPGLSAWLATFATKEEQLAALRERIELSTCPEERYTLAAAANKLIFES